MFRESKGETVTKTILKAMRLQTSYLRDTTNPKQNNCFKSMSVNWRPLKAQRKSLKAACKKRHVIYKGATISTAAKFSTKEPANKVMVTTMY